MRAVLIRKNRQRAAGGDAAGTDGLYALEDAARRGDLSAALADERVS